MNNNEFTEQFKQNIKAPAVPPTSTTQQSNKLYLTAIIALSAVLIFESIALIIITINYFSSVNEYDDVVEDYSITVEGSNPGELFFYDNDDNLVSVNTNCTNNETGNYIVLSSDKSIKEYDSTNSLSNSDTYTIINDTIISLSNDTDRVLYFDDDTLYDGLVIYDCTYDRSSTTEEE